MTPKLLRNKPNIFPYIEKDKFVSGENFMESFASHYLVFYVNCLDFI